MNVVVSTLCAAALALSPVAFGPASAGSTAPAGLNAAVLHASAPGDLVEVRGHRFQGQHYHPHRRGVDRRGHHRHGFHDRSRRGHPHWSHRHYRDHRRGPDLGSAIVGAIIGGIIVHQFQQQPRPQPRAHGSFLSREHINWCRNRWRSYRLSDNSYQPYHGPRRICVSPYGPT